MADNSNSTWFSDLLAGRTKEEREAIMRFVEGMFAPRPEARDGYAVNRADESASLRRFNLAYSDWLRARGLQAQPDQDEEVANVAMDLESDAVRRLIGEPAWLDWQLWQKIEMLDAYFDAVQDDWRDKRFTRLYGSIKADLAHLGVGKGESA